MKLNQCRNFFRSDIQSKKTYSQLGEDLIIKNYFDSIKVFTPTYIDIGAFDPFNLSNTALFYELGSIGINVEPNPAQFKMFIKHRRKDINLNIGIGAKDGQLDYHMMSSAVLNTFSHEKALEYESEWGFRILDIIPIQVRTLSWVIQNYLQGKFPDFMSLDSEGMEDDIIQEMKTLGSLPSLICIETLTFAMDSSGVKRNSLTNALMALGFEIYADTHLNTILVNKS